MGGVLRDLDYQGVEGCLDDPEIFQSRTPSKVTGLLGSSGMVWAAMRVWACYEGSIEHKDRLEVGQESTWEQVQVLAQGLHKPAELQSSCDM